LGYFVEGGIWSWGGWPVGVASSVAGMWSLSDLRSGFKAVSSLEWEFAWVWLLGSIFGEGAAALPEWVLGG